MRGTQQWPPASAQPPPAPEPTPGSGSGEATAQFTRWLTQEGLTATAEEAQRLKRAFVAGYTYGHGGRLPALTTGQATEAKHRREAGESWSALARSYGVTRPTVQRAIERIGTEDKSEG